MAKGVRQFKLTREQQVLARTNMNLARNIAWKYQRRTNIEYSILESAAFEGLCQAAAKYDPELVNDSTGRPMKFSSLAVPYIRGAVLHYIRDKTYSMRLTHKMRETWVKGRKLLNRGMSDIEIAKELEVDLKYWQDAKSACSGPPLELKDQAQPTEALEPDEVDRLTSFRQEASEILSRLPEALKAKLERFSEGRAHEPPRTLRTELDAFLVDG